LGRSDSFGTDADIEEANEEGQCGHNHERVRVGSAALAGSRTSGKGSNHLEDNLLPADRRSHSSVNRRSKMMSEDISKSASMRKQ